MTRSVAVDRVDDRSSPTARIAALMADYTQYVQDQHAICRGCPVVRAGVPLVRLMLEWKAARADRRLEHWTRQDVRDYLLRYLPTANVGRALLGDAPRVRRISSTSSPIAAGSRATLSAC